MSYQQHLKTSSELVVRCAIVTLSDTRTLETDTSGGKIAELLNQAGHIVVERLLLKDDPAPLAATMIDLLNRENVDAILTTGGTGISRRDQSVDVMEQLIEQPLPGFGELFRQLSYTQIGSGAMLSRAVGGIAKGKVIFAMPGSTGAVELGMGTLIIPEIRHLVFELRK